MCGTAGAIVINSNSASLSPPEAGKGHAGVCISPQGLDEKFAFGVGAVRKHAARDVLRFLQFCEKRVVNYGLWPLWNHVTSREPPRLGWGEELEYG